MPEKEGLLEEMEEEDKVEYYSDVTKYLVEEDSLPQRVKEKFWLLPSKDTVLSNLDNRDVDIIMLEFDSAYLVYLMSKPEHEYSFQDELNYLQARAKLRLKLKRSLYGFERKMIATQIKRMEYEEQNEQKKGGILSKLLPF